MDLNKNHSSSPTTLEFTAGPDCPYLAPKMFLLKKNRRLGGRMTFYKIKRKENEKKKEKAMKTKETDKLLKR
uniref:Uncharacterized protein n=1 Tax=Romanomermis culicivorax TaxID=13658 RepID=A0A915KYL5_ROMCU